MDEVKEAIWIEPDPYWACPNCESGRWGAIDPFAKELTYRCHECNTLFKIPMQVHGLS